MGGRRGSALTRMKTVYLQGDDAREFEKTGYCKACLRPAKEWARPDRFGNYEVRGDFDRKGNLAGFLCPECVKETVPPGCECPYCGENRVDWVLAPDDDGFCFCLRCRRYYDIMEN